MLTIIVCVGLAGCAATHTPNTAYSSALDAAELNMAASSSDPIGTLVTYKLNRARHPTVAQPLIDEALGHLGVRYRYGGNSPHTGFDCSGLVVYSVERSLGVKLPRSASAMALMGTSIHKAQLRPGDLVFFNTLGRRYSHVGIYLGNDRFVHSPSAGGVVRIEKMTQAYWTKRYNGARRLETDLLAAAQSPAR